MKPTNSLLARYLRFVESRNWVAAEAFPVFSRSLRAVLWTLLAVFIPNGIGVVLYFILREPMPSYCSKCGSPAKQGHAFCPSCGANVLPSCSQCHRAGQPGWSHCAWCGAKL